MKNLLSVILIAAFVGTTALQPSGTSEQDSKQEIRNRFIGAWRLVWLEVVTHLACYAGWPDVFSASPVVKDVFEERAH